MCRPPLVALFLAAILFATEMRPSLATSPSDWSLNINGRLVELVRSGDDPTPRFTLLVNKENVFSDSTDRFVSVAGVYTGGGRIYLLLEEQSGGNVCESEFQAFDLSAARTAKSPKFGNCAINPQVAIVNGAQKVTTLAYKSRFGSIVPEDSITFRDGHFQRQ